MGALAHQQQQIMHHQQFSKPPEVVPVFIGSISSGIGDSFLNELLSVSGERLVILEPQELIVVLPGLRSHTTSETADNASRETPRIWFL